ncbi:MAG: hypothetical protein QOG62_2412 [Thermoleophilaceae bacterium]|jgi:hypothetical protein|nr:hypothetical protein [Thermoleophilaceae bacterium]
MIEIVPDMPEGVTGIRVSGKLSGEDLQSFKSKIEKVMNTEEIRIVEIIDPGYEGFGPGGLLEDLKIGFEALFHHHGAWKRIAVVSDETWVAHALHAFAWMIPGEMEIFGQDQLEEAKTFAAG